MNWKIVSLIAGLTLTASLAACSGNPAQTNQTSPTASPSADAMKKDGDAMKKDGDAMKKDGDAMKSGDAMKKDTPSKP
jgi:pentapeptide MXKDX repeat protein